MLSDYDQAPHEFLKKTQLDSEILASLVVECDSSSFKHLVHSYTKTALSWTHVANAYWKRELRECQESLKVKAQSSISIESLKKNVADMNSFHPTIPNFIPDDPLSPEIALIIGKRLWQTLIFIVLFTVFFSATELMALIGWGPLLIAMTAVFIGTALFPFSSAISVKHKEKYFFAVKLLGQAGYTLIYTVPRLMAYLGRNAMLLYYLSKNSKVSDIKVGEHSLIAETFFQAVRQLFQQSIHFDKTPINLEIIHGLVDSINRSERIQNAMTWILKITCKILEIIVFYPLFYIIPAVACAGNLLSLFLERKINFSSFQASSLDPNYKERECEKHKTYVNNPEDILKTPFDKKKQDNVDQKVSSALELMKNPQR
jgi:hypothetical protein